MKNKIGDLRDHLFEVIEGLKDKESPMDIDRARAVAEVAKVLIDSAKVEVEHLKVTGAAAGSGFIPEEKPALGTPERPRLVNGK